MGVSIEQYRCAIGLFNKFKCTTCIISFSSLFHCFLNLSFLFIAVMLLILAGDIELHPGPVKCRNLNICHINIRSLSRSKLLAIKTSIAERFDIITLSETHLHAGVPNDLFKIDGFHDIIRKDRTNQDGGGGVAIYVKNSIAFKRLFQFESANLEALWIQVNTIGGKIIVCSCYRPPENNMFWPDMSDALDDVKQYQLQNLFILGDLNADPETYNGRKLKEFCDFQNLACTVNEPTRITDSTATILDQVLTNSACYINKIEVTPPVSTNDHCTVGCFLDFKISKEVSYERFIWQYNKANFNEFRNALSTTNFDQCFTDDDIDNACEKWTQLFLSVAKEHIPNKKVIIRPNDSPWYTSELRCFKRKVTRAYHKYKSKGMSSEHFESYKKLRNTYQQQLDEAEQVYRQSLTSSLSVQRNSKSWWNTVKSLLGKGGDTSYPPLIVNDNAITENKAKAEAFNNFFLSHSNINDSNAELPNPGILREGLINIDITEEEVHDLIKCINVSKATGPDEVSPRLLKEADATIVPSLTKLFKMSIRLSKVPSSWKLANVLPLFKKGNNSDLNNYRPVSLLSCVSKLLERIIFKHLFNYLRTNLLLSKHQSGFQPGDSTTNQLSYIYHTIAEALDKKKDVCIIFCDISKAFDRVWHKGLIFKLKKAGVGGPLLHWFTDYLSNRHQSVVIRGQKSELGHIKAGVPQGSVLGPLLFLIYINDITEHIHSNVKLFADDTSLHIEFDSIETASAALTEDMQRIQSWADQWLVKFSPTKTKLMHCSFRNKDVVPVRFNGINIENVQHHKHLGLVLSQDLSWSNHVENVIKNVSPMIDVLKKLKYDLDRKTIETIYFSFIRPKLEYGSHIWDNCSKFDSDRLETIQHTMAKILTGARKGTSHALLYNECNWLSLEQRRKQIKLKSLIKVINKETPKYLQDLLPYKIGMKRENSRQPDNFFNMMSRTEKFRSSFIPSAIRMWNNTNNNERSIQYIKSYMNCKSSQLFNYGCRKYGIIHAQMRMQCSKLNDHLFKLHVVDSPACPCGHTIENNEHFLLNCPLYNDIRYNLFKALHDNFDIENNTISTKMLLEGYDAFDYNKNCLMFDLVHKFLEASQRF